MNSSPERLGAIDVARDLDRCAKNREDVPLWLKAEYDALPLGERGFVDGYLTAMIDNVRNGIEAARPVKAVRTTKAVTLVRIGSIALVRAKQEVAGDA